MFPGGAGLVTVGKEPGLGSCRILGMMKARAAMTSPKPTNGIRTINQIHLLAFPIEVAALRLILIWVGAGRIASGTEIELLQ